MMHMDGIFLILRVGYSANTHSIGGLSEKSLGLSSRCRWHAKWCNIL